MCLGPGIKTMIRKKIGIGMRTRKKRRIGMRIRIEIGIRRGIRIMSVSKCEKRWHITDHSSPPKPIQKVIPQEECVRR